MRIGRLQPSTLASIWKSIEVNDANDSTQIIQKSYIPCTVDSPLYRLISVNASTLNGRIATNSNSLPDTIANPVTSNNPQVASADSADHTLPDTGSIPTNQLELPVEETLNFVTHAPTSVRGVSVPNLQSEELHNHLPLPRVVQSASDLFHTTTTIGVEERSSRVVIARTISFIHHNNPADKKIVWEEEYAHIDIDWSMQAMDVLYNASFYEYIRDERNVDLSAVRLSRIIKDYKPKQVASALLWMIQGWSVENSAKLFRIVFGDWLPDLAGCIFGLVSKNWPKKPQCSLCTAYILISEPATSSALFLRSLTQGWERKDSIDIITYLDSVLKWETPFLQEVMSVYSDSFYAEKLRPIDSEKESILLESSRKLMIANARLQMAEYQLALFSHWSNCIQCQSHQECEVVDKMSVPDGTRSKTFLDSTPQCLLTDKSTASLQLTKSTSSLFSNGSQ